MDEQRALELHKKLFAKHTDKSVTMEDLLWKTFPREASLLTEAQYNSVTHKKKVDLKKGCFTPNDLPRYINAISKDIWEKEEAVRTGKLDLEQYLADFLSIEYASFWLLQEIDRRYCEVLVEEQEAFDIVKKEIESNTRYLKHDATFDLEEVSDACYVEEDICECEEDNF